MAFTVYNTLTRRREAFEPLEPGKVRMYTCGPTVYDYAHLGNFRAYLFEDLLRRRLESLGFKVIQVMNLTDVDDKTIRGARQAGRPLAEFTRPFKDAFFEDLRALNIRPAEHYPAATDHIPAMIALVQRLFDVGVAYRSGDGSVYFSIAKFPAYGRLAQVDRAGLRPGARVAQDEYQKENLADFALWKAWTPQDGEVGWEAPWGRGRPGWHLECSAMSMQYLGPSFDLHTGGVDNIFPHHEDEMAQSEAATGQTLARYWVHCAHLVVDGCKMSKSAGNFYTLRDLLARGWTGREVRYALLAAHYRQELNFTLDSLAAARAALQRLDEFRERLQTAAGDAAPGRADDWLDSARAAFAAALDDDLNAPVALAALFELVRAGHKLLDQSALAAPACARVLRTLAELDENLGCLQAAGGERPDAETLRLAAAREAARRQRDWREADRLRAALAVRGWQVQDTAAGSRLQRGGGP